MKNEPAETSVSLTKASAKSGTWNGVSPCNGRCWGLIRQKTALQKRTGSFDAQLVEHDFTAEEQHW